MRILYIYREKEKNEHSIEAVFDTVAEILKDFGHYVHKWYKPVSWRQTFREIWQLRKEGYDIYHITGDVNYLWLFFPWRKTTMTCHDIGMYKNNPKSIIRILYVFISFISWVQRYEKLFKLRSKYSISNAIYAIFPQAF